MSEFRKHGRLAVNSLVKVTHDLKGEITAHTRDISETGMFLSCQDMPLLVRVGETFTAHVFDTPDAPKKRKLRVVRLCHDGVGFKYD